MAERKSPKQLSGLLSYILGRRPDEFGLVLDPEGFVRIKELLKAVCEEEGWRYVRRSHIDELLITLPDPPVEIKENLIRAKDRSKLTQLTLAENLPKILYTCVRQKAHPFVMENGISPAGHSHVILSSSPELAEKIGKRFDPEPVLLTVHVGKSTQEGVVFYRAGDALFLAGSIHADCFSGPPLPKQKMETRQSPEQKKDVLPRLRGSYIIDLEETSAQKTRAKQKKEWRDFKKKKGQRKERPPWRS